MTEKRRIKVLFAGMAGGVALWAADALCVVLNSPVSAVVRRLHHLVVAW